MISPNVIIIWPGTHAGIPNGYVRETSLDGKYPKAAANAVQPNATGGSNTHSHTSSAHTHTMVSHSHSGSTDRGGDFETHGGTNSDVARDNHYHDYNISGVIGGSLSDAVTYASANGEPPYYSVIFIKASGFRPVPSNAIVLFGKTTIPTGFNNCDGGGDPARPDLRNRYLKGANTDSNAGATGGTLNHQHNVTHTHSNASHSHRGNSGYDSNYESNRRRGDNLNGAGGAVPRHTHVVDLYAKSESSSQYSGYAGSADTVEPAYKKLLAIQNTSGKSLNPQPGTIGMWLGNLADIPSGWFLCDGNNGTPDMRDKFLKIASIPSEIGNTGGSNTHSHSASNSHTHTALASHVHKGATDTMGIYYGTSADADGVSKVHSHNITTNSSANTSSWNNSTISSNSSDGQPAFRTVAYIMFRYFVGGGILLNLI